MNRAALRRAAEAALCSLLHGEATLVKTLEKKASAGRAPMHSLDRSDKPYFADRGQISHRLNSALLSTTICGNIPDLSLTLSLQKWKTTIYEDGKMK
jgi:hypothetical protein